ncbi:hypothetical protein ACYSNL_10035 [Enterococcus cecorum]
MSKKKFSCSERGVLNLIQNFNMPINDMARKVGTHEKLDKIIGQLVRKGVCVTVRDNKYFINENSNELATNKLTKALELAEQSKRATLYDEQRANKEELLYIADNQITLLMQVLQLLEE